MVVRGKERTYTTTKHITTLLLHSRVKKEYAHPLLRCIAMKQVVSQLNEDHWDHGSASVDCSVNAVVGASGSPNNYTLFLLL